LKKDTGGRKTQVGKRHRWEKDTGGRKTQVGERHR